MSGVDPSRLVNDLRSSLSELQQSFAFGSRTQKASSLPWEELLSREESRLDGAASEDSTPWSLPASARALPQVLQSLALSSAPWTDALSALRARSEGRTLGPAGGTGSADGPAANRKTPPAGTSAAEGLVPSQFDPSLSPQEAAAACGPAAAVAFARAGGHDLSLREAVDLARTVGWTPVGGMNGVANQKRLLDKIGVPVRVDTSGDWNRVAEEVSSGQPVTISTQGHYFVADAYDPQTGRFHVGASGTSYRNGKEWMSRQEMEVLAGPINGSLVMDGQRRWTA